ncbi:MAG TPA: rod shape-determining protein [Thermoanaerobaculia bacterium]|nr:rod shape-determining protein [Thermoanaerobaculia bacterium]
MLATAPGDASEEERIALRTALHRAGAGNVMLIPEPVAAAVGAGLAGATSVRMLVDIGEGVTEVALVSRGVLLHHASIRLACAEMREAPNAAIATIAAFIAHVYVDLDRHLRERVGRSAICLTGGGALVDAMRNEIERALELPVYVPDDPLRAVIRGARRLLDGEAAHVWSGFGDVAV